MRGLKPTVAAVLAVSVVGGLVAGPVRSPAGASPIFTGGAEASGVTITAATQEDPTGTTVEASGPNVTAMVSSLPDSEAFSADPYPGTDLLDLMNTLGGSAPVPPPAYPFEASSSFPGRARSSLSQPGYRLSATSSQSASDADGQAGVSSGGIRIGSVDSQAHVGSGGPVAVVSAASSRADGFSAGPLTISAVTSRARAVLTSSGTTELSSSTAIGRIAVNGVPVGLGPDGLTVAGTTVPLPPAGPLASALARAGISVSLIAASRSATGVVAPGVAVTTVQADPNGRRWTVTYALGLAAASAEPTVPGGAAALGIPAGTGPSGFGSGGYPAGIPSPSGPSSLSAAAGSSPAAGSPSSRAGRLPSGPATPGSAAGTYLPAGRSASGPGGPDMRAAGAVIPQTAGLGGLFYLLLVIAAAAALGAGQAMRFMGVRWARSSD